MTIADNGVGIERASRGHQGLGLQIMNYRARLIGASLEVANGQTDGTIVSCLVPRRERDPKTEGDDLV
jgi:nitrate/nitrite-specific signal transduction histidine kinase